MQPIHCTITLIWFALAITAASSAQRQQTPFIATTGSDVSVTGEWKAISGRAGEELAFKHVVEIRCSKSTGTCVEANASVVNGNPDLLVNYYDVLHWDTNGLTAQNGKAKCATNQLDINFQSESVIFISSPKKRVEGCKPFDTLTYRLVKR